MTQRNTGATAAGSGSGSGTGTVSPSTADTSGKKHSAGAFDIRTFIGSLLGLYGLILTLMGLVGDKALDKTGGINANLWAGLGLLLTSAFFIAWARLKPILVPEHVDAPVDDPTRPAPRRGGH